MVTSSSMTLGTPESQWMTALSWTLTRRPRVMGATSPRRTALNQREDCGPMVTSPVTREERDL